MPLDTWNLSGTQGNVFLAIRVLCATLSRIFHSTNQSATGGIPVQRSTGRPVAKGEERIGSTIPMPMFLQEGRQEFYGCTAKAANIGASV